MALNTFVVGFFLALVLAQAGALFYVTPVQASSVEARVEEVCSLFNGIERPAWESGL